MGNRRAALIRAAQHAATRYSLPTGHLLESLVREVSCDHAERVLELTRRIDDEATTAAYQSLPRDPRIAGTRARSRIVGPGSASMLLIMSRMLDLTAACPSLA